MAVVKLQKRRKGAWARIVRVGMKIAGSFLGEVAEFVDAYSG